MDLGELAQRRESGESQERYQQSEFVDSTWRNNEKCDCLDDVQEVEAVIVDIIIDSYSRIYLYRCIYICV